MTEVWSVVAKGMVGDSVLGLEKVGLQCRVKVVEFGGLEWEVGISSELGKPELEWGVVSGCREVDANPEPVDVELGWMVGVSSEFEGLWGVVESDTELRVLEWMVGFASEMLKWLVKFSIKLGELWLEE